MRVLKLLFKSMRVWYNGIIFRYQRKDVGSIPTARSNHIKKRRMMSE